MWTSPITDKENVWLGKNKKTCTLHFFLCHTILSPPNEAGHDHLLRVLGFAHCTSVFLWGAAPSQWTRNHEQLNNSRAVVTINIIFAPKNPFLCTLLPLMWSWLLKSLLVCSPAERGSVIKDQHDGSVTNRLKGSQCFSHFIKLHDSAHFFYIVMVWLWCDSFFFSQS